MDAERDIAIELTDGRRLAISAVGPRDGFPVLYLHGAIGAPRWCTPQLRALIAARTIRYTLVYRPGFGLSDGCEQRCVADFASDLQRVVDTLGYDRFSLVGVSSGAPYALAGAAALGERVCATAVVSPLAPPCGAGASPSPRYRVPTLAFGSPCVGPALGHASLAAMRLRRATPSRAMVEDYAVCRRPWGFDPAQVPAGVRLWHGTRDRLVPLSHALRLANALPSCRTSLVPGVGHFFYRDWLAEIVTPLIEAGRRIAIDRVAA